MNIYGQKTGLANVPSGPKRRVPRRVTAILLIPMILSILWAGLYIDNLVELDVFNVTSIMMVLGIMLETYPSISWTFVGFNFGAEIFLAVYALILKHISEGVDNIIDDYVKNGILKVLIFVCTRTVLIIVFKYTYSFFILL